MLTILGFRLSERQTLFVYLLTATLLLTGLAGWGLYHAHNLELVNVQVRASEIKRQQQLFVRQERYLYLLDSTHSAIAAYRPNVRDEFAEASIEKQISQLRQLSATSDTLHGRGAEQAQAVKDSVQFFRAFAQAAAFYQMMYDDKKCLAIAQENVRQRTEDLAQCLIGFQPTAPRPAVQAVQQSAASVQP